MTVKDAPRPRIRPVRRGAYMLPSLFTIGNILLGFYAVVLGLRATGAVPGALLPHDVFGTAALLVFGAAILDSLDGRIARMTGTESDFGKEYDSLADVFTFGAVPALLTYLWGLSELGRAGWLVPFFFLVCTATRLARFNVQTKVVDARYFVGLPTPAAAGTVCSILFFAPYAEWRSWMLVFTLIAMALIGALMVSTIRYHSFKKLDLRKRWSYRVFVIIAAVILVIVFEPRATFLAIAVTYTLSGPAGYLWGRLRRRPGDADTMPPPLPPDAGGPGPHLP
ncbi:MAG TPA: CDP-diacylglycerol--serine O-phosphatidyltransferase [Thermoanaerobaculia bacterium]|nr:CDP-diacylglycerol--serine O-phosphatidyltransferase [Thermoanaerobaculia bacterium]